MIHLAWIATTCFTNNVAAVQHSETSIRSSRDTRDTQVFEQDQFRVFEPLNSRNRMAESPNQVPASDRRYTDDTSTSKHRQLLRRRLPGNDYNMEGLDMMSAEAGFALGLSCFIILLLLLCCCCCGRRGGGGGGSSCLWDLVAVACLWEMCCDNDGVSDGFLRF
jgi:hypothetical protein